MAGQAEMNRSTVQLASGTSWQRRSPEVQMPQFPPRRPFSKLIHFGPDSSYTLGRYGALSASAPRQSGAPDVRGMSIMYCRNNRASAASRLSCSCDSFGFTCLAEIDDRQKRRQSASTSA